MALWHAAACLVESVGLSFADVDNLYIAGASGNVGLNDESVLGLPRSTGNDEFARDCYRRLIQMFGETVDGSFVRLVSCRNHAAHADATSA